MIWHELAKLSESFEFYIQRNICHGPHGAKMPGLHIGCWTQNFREDDIEMTKTLAIFLEYRTQIHRLV